LKFEVDIKNLPSFMRGLPEELVGFKELCVE
jgi:hypothetical protein